MHPVIFKIGFFELRSWEVTFAISTFVGIYVASRRAPRFGIAKNELRTFLAMEQESWKGTM